MAPDPDGAFAFLQSDRAGPNPRPDDGAQNQVVPFADWFDGGYKIFFGEGLAGVKQQEVQDDKN